MTIPVIIHNESRGTFKLTNGDLAHFSQIEVASELLFAVEVLDPQGRLRGVIPLERRRLSNPRRSLPLFAEAKDSRDRFFVADYRDGQPLIRVISFQYEKR